MTLMRRSFRRLLARMMILCVVQTALVYLLCSLSVAQRFPRVEYDRQPRKNAVNIGAILTHRYRYHVVRLQKQEISRRNKRKLMNKNRQGDPEKLHSELRMNKSYLKIRRLG